MAKKRKRGEAGNAVLYMTRNQALKKLQLKLAEFRRLCILKGIHPREPKKKPSGQGKTYYHAKDIAYLAHEPLLNKFRDAYAYEKKIRKARAKRNAELAERLLSRRPGYRLDHLVKERYPSFVDALRDLDDPLTLVHLFAQLPADKTAGIPVKVVHTARRLALEWQAVVVRLAALRRVFVSVKGFYFQAEVAGQAVTWLVPHQLAQVLPPDVDWRVMLTFLEFYTTLLQFVNFKLYHQLGLAYPPVVDPRLEQAAAGLASLMQDLAQSQPSEDGQPSLLAAAQPALRQSEQRQSAPAAADTSHAERTANGAAAADTSSASDDEAEETEQQLGIDSGSDSEDEEEPSGSEGGGEEDGSDMEGGSEDSDSDELAAHAAASTAAAAGAGRADADAGDAVSAEVGVAGGAVGVDAADPAAVCGALFQGLTFWLSREVPREQLLFVIRAFGGRAGWEGEGSPFQENDESITHQVVDRPRQGHRYMAREYVQPQWVLDSANFRVLARAQLYAPGLAPPPHLSPFVEGQDDQGYTPDYAKELLALQEAAEAVRRRSAHTAAAGTFVGEGPAGEEAAAGPGGEADVAALEQRHAAELAQELQVERGEGDGQGDEGGGAAAARVPGAAAPAAPAGEEGAPEEGDLAAAMMTRKNRKLYASLQRKASAKRERAQQLLAKRAKLAM